MKRSTAITIVPAVSTDQCTPSRPRVWPTCACWLARTSSILISGCTPPWWLRRPVLATAVLAGEAAGVRPESGLSRESPLVLSKRRATGLGSSGATRSGGCARRVDCSAGRPRGRSLEP